MVNSEHYKYLIVGLILLSLLFFGCTQPTPNPQPVNTTPNSNSGSGAATAVVAISNFQFSPDTLTIVAGTKVTWTNNDVVPHTVTFDSFDSKPISSGESFTHQFDAPGTYNYHCAIHPSMVGKIVVTAK